MRGAEAGLYAASARRVLRARGLQSLGERLRGSDDRLVFVVGSPRSGTTFFAGVLGEQPGFVDLSEVNPHKAAIPSLAGLPEAEAARRVRAVLEESGVVAAWMNGGYRVQFEDGSAAWAATDQVATLNGLRVLAPWSDG